MRKKRFTTGLLTLCIIFNIFYALPVKAVEPDANPNIAQAILGQALAQTGFKTVEMGTNSSGDSIGQQGGEYGWLLDKTKGREKAFLNFALSDEFKPTLDDGSEYVISIDYYDGSTGAFKVEYDALDKVSKKAGLVETSNTKVWKTAEFKLTDANFKNRIADKYDFRIKICDFLSVEPTSKSSVLIKRVRVTRDAAKNPIRVSASIDKPGNTFEWYADSKVINTSLKNLTDKRLSADVRFKLTGIYENECPYDEVQNLTFTPGEEKEISIDVGAVKQCDIYKYNISIENSDNSIDSSVDAMEAVIMKTDPNGIQNENVYFSVAPAHRYNGDNFEKTIDVAQMTNARGIRAEVCWWAVVNPDGESIWNGSSSQQMAQILKNHNMDLIALLTNAPGWAVPHWGYYPRTTEQLEKWSIFTQTAANELNLLGFDKFEIWNEGNAMPQNWTYAEDGKTVLKYGGELYANMYKIAKQNITSVIADAKVAGPTAAGTLRDDAKYHFLEAMNAKDAEFWKYDNVLSLHSYPWHKPEGSNQITDVEWYRNQYKEHGVDNIEVWHSETGYTPYCPATKNSEWKTAYMNVRLALQHKRESTGDIVSFYTLPQTGELTSVQEDTYGMASGSRNTNDYPKDGKVCVPKIPLLAVTAYNYIMADSEVTEKISTGDENLLITKLRSNKFNQNLLTIHNASNTDKNIRMNLGVDSVKVYDLLGNERDVFGQNGVFEFTAAAEPIYVLGNFENAEIPAEVTVTKNGDTINVKGILSNKSKEKNFSLFAYSDYVEPGTIDFGKMLTIYQGKCDGSRTFDYTFKINNMPKHIYVNIMSQTGEYISASTKDGLIKKISIFPIGASNADIGAKSFEDIKGEIIGGGIKFENTDKKFDYLLTLAAYKNRQLISVNAVRDGVTDDDLNQIDSENEIVKYYPNLIQSVNLSDADEIKLFLWNANGGNSPVCSIFCKNENN